MLRRLLTLTFATAVCLAQDQKPATLIEGVAVDAATRASLAGVTVALAPADTADDVVTGVVGTFRFAEIPAGKYRVSAKLEGYGEAARFLDLRTMASPEKITLSLTPLSRISGRVVDEDGKAAAGVEVTAGAGHKAETDASGNYELEDLSLGEYRLAFRLPTAMRRETAEKNEKTGEVFGYADRIYYPGVTDARAAAPITIASRAPVAGVNVKLKRTRLVEVSGQVLDKATGQPLASADIELVAAGGSVAGRQGDSLERKRVAADGSFRFDLVPPGSYEALVRRNGGVNYNAAPYRMPCEVDQHGLSAAELRIPEYVTLTVNILPHIDWPFRGTLRMVIGGGASGFTCSFGSGETCVIADVPPGPFRLVIGANLLPTDRRDAGKIRNFRVKSIRFGQQDAANTPILVAEGANPPIEVTFTDQFGGISATVLNEDGQDAESAAFRVSRVDGDLTIPVPDPGARNSYSPFSIAGLIPGEYWIAAFPAPDNGSSMRTVAPLECGDRAARVLITAGQTTSIVLHPCIVR